MEDPAPPDLSIFVYGTLKPGGAYWPDFCEGKVGEPIPAKIKGELYDLHVGYPGLRLAGENWVQGFILTFRREMHLDRVDYLEGYDPRERRTEKNEYIRLKVPCFSPEGEELGEFWTYEMTDHTMDQLKGTLMPEGDWPIEGTGN